MKNYGNSLKLTHMPSLKRKIMRDYTRVTYNNAEISKRDTEFLECWENPAHAQTVCTRPSSPRGRPGNEARCACTGEALSFAVLLGGGGGGGGG